MANIDKSTNPIANAGVDNQSKFLKVKSQDLVKHARKDQAAKSRIESSLTRLEKHKEHKVKTHAANLKKELSRNSSWKQIKAPEQKK